MRSLAGPLIIGGGPAGAAAAIVLAGAGRPVTLLERHAGPADKLCGDFLSGGAVAALHRLGLDVGAVAGMPIVAIRLVHRRAVAEAPLPFPAMAMSRRRLDAGLLDLARQRGATVLRGEAVHGLQHDRRGFAARTAHGDVLQADTVFVATGKHDLRGLARPSRPDGLIGLKMYYRLAPGQDQALRNTIELFLFRNGYAGLQRVAQDRAVLCLLLPAARYRAAGGDWQSLLDSVGAELPLLADRLAGAAPCLELPLAIAGTPYGHLHRQPADAPTGLFRLGDQACVVPSFAGDGMAIALHSGMQAAIVWLRGGSGAEYHAAFARRAAVPLRIAGLIHAACRTPATQVLLAIACRTWPASLRLAASLTRVARPAEQSGPTA